MVFANELAEQVDVLGEAHRDGQAIRLYRAEVDR
jgi:hypothetical protein